MLTILLGLTLYPQQARTTESGQLRKEHKQSSMWQLTHGDIDQPAQCSVASSQHAATSPALTSPQSLQADSLWVWLPGEGCYQTYTDLTAVTASGQPVGVASGRGLLPVPH